MNFLGVGGLELLLIFAVAMFFLGPKRLALGVREGRKYYRELRKYRQELTDMVKDAIDADDLKKELEQTKKDAWDESITQELTGVQDDLKLGDDSLDIPELDLTRSVPKKRGSGSVVSNAMATDGDTSDKNAATDVDVPQPDEESDRSRSDS
jgi:Tat protein translocase TatB subunit